MDRLSINRNKGTENVGLWPVNPAGGWAVRPVCNLNHGFSSRKVHGKRKSSTRRSGYGKSEGWQEVASRRQQVVQAAKRKAETRVM